MADIADIAATAMPIENIKRQEEAPWAKRIFGSFLFRRVLRAIFTIFFVSTAIFFLVRLLPGDPVQVYINQQMTQFGYSYDDAKNQAQSLYAIDVDKPLIAQYFDYMKGLLQGDLGMSLTSSGNSVLSIINSRIWWTIFSVGTALLISFGLGSLLGMVMAYRRNTPSEGLLSGFASITQSIPNYLLAILIIITLGVRLGWIPFTKMRGAVSSGQEVEFSWAFISDAIYHASLPIAVYVFTSIGGWMLLMKSSTIAALEEDFVTAARARGVPEWRVLFFYVGRNAILPLFTQLAIAIGFVVGGSLLVEPIFQYEGIGQRLFQALQRRDYTLLQGILLMVTISVVVANLIADLLYSRLDPRIRSGNN
jgi:peptide/nickel transport system permease protein